MGVDTTTNLISHTQAQSVIKAQKGGSPSAFPNPHRKGKRKKKRNRERYGNRNIKRNGEEPFR